MSVWALAVEITQKIIRHELKRRKLTVAGVQDLSPVLRRITFTGADLVSLRAEGPADHLKLFFPDPQTGELSLPQMNAEGRAVPTPGNVISRDYTPRRIRRGSEATGPEATSPEAASSEAASSKATGPETIGSEAAGSKATSLDIDFVLHGDSGPASHWAARAKVGDTLFAGGPRGSKLFPSPVARLVVLADESALPAAARWLEQATVPTEMLLIAVDEPTTRYLDEVPQQPTAVTWFTGADRYSAAEAALRGLAQQEGTYYFLAGEATALIPMRRYLRRELGLERNVVAVDGYWKRGVVGLDHHAPIDASDPD